MHFKKKMRQGLSAALITAMSLGNVMSAQALPQERGGVNSTVSISTDSYKAEVDLNTGGLSLSKNSNLEEPWNSTDQDKIPGATMFLQADNTARQAEAQVESSMDTGEGTAGAAGIKLSGELSGVKSYFMFEDEILLLGAGIENAGASQDKVITVVDNVPVTKNTKAALPNPWNGYRGVLDAVSKTDPKNSWSSVVDSPTQGSHARNWMAASDLSGTGNPLQWKYIFEDTITNSLVWYNFSTDGAEEPKQFELWVEPVDGAYQYTLKAGGMQTDFNGITLAEPENTVLSNTEQVQAAENASEGTVAVNKWSEGETAVASSVADLTVTQPASVVVKKDDAAKTASIIVAKSSEETSGYIEITAGIEAVDVKETSGGSALEDFSVEDGQLYLKLDVSKMDEPVSLEVSYELPEVVTGDEITLVRGEEKQVEKPDDFSDNITWSAKFQKPNGTYLRNVGSSKIKRELKEGETDGTRTAGDTSAEHLLGIKTLPDGNVIVTAKEKGNLVLVAEDDQGKEKIFKVEILHEDPSTLPQTSSEDYAKIRQTWKESLIGANLASQDGGAEILKNIDLAAKEAWDAYAYKGQESCPDIPWPEDEGAAGNAEIAYEDDAVEFRPAFKKVLSMAEAYAAEGSEYYQDPDLLKDMTNILDYLCTTCYAPKSQTDNWWTWEIGIPKDLIPALILIYDGLTKEQVMQYTEGLYFFQPDPYFEGAVGTASTHAQGYRENQGANLVDCSTTAVGIGALREDNELIYLGMMASSETFVIQEVEDSTKIAAEGYASGFYPDGSYLDHSRVPYIGSYGIEFMKGGVKIPSLIGGTPWQYPDEVQQNLEYYIVEGFGSAMYRGLMLDSLKGRSVARPASSNQASGREAMTIILQMVDSLSDESRATVLSALKYWLECDPEYIDSLTGAENMAIKAKAQDILADSSIEAYVPPMHKSFPLMDRAIHRTDNYLFAVSMYSERIQNTEIMNDENRMGWHQNNGMTYIYDSDQDQYTDNFWNTVNPLRLPGTTVVPVNIGTGQPDSTGYAQGGDFCSYESWVGGSSIGDYGISGMAFSGAISDKAKSGDTGAISYAPNLKGKKSWFMFDDEIVALGAGITNSGMDLPVETTVENRRLGENADNTFLVDGEETNLPIKEAKLTELLDRSADVSGTSFENVKWAHLEGSESAGTGYYFPSDGTEIQARRARTTGNWSDIGTSEGESTQDYLEMWFDHGKNPSDASYSYVLLPETTADETMEYAQNPEITVLMNTASAQAVYHKGLGITGINFWEDKSVQVGDVTCDSQASVMLQETDEGLLTVAVSDPTMKNTGTIRLTIDKPVSAVGDMDENVSCEQHDDGSVELSFAMKGTNGASSYAELQLAASIYPAAATAEKGGEQAFEVRDYDQAAGTAEWSVKGFESELSAGTVIDENGVLTIDANETNSALEITAKTESGLTLTAYVSLGGDAVAELPEDMKKIQDLIDAAFKAAEEGEDAQEAIGKAVAAVQSADNERLAAYLMDSILELGALYEEEWGIMEYSESVAGAECLEPVNAQGMILSIRPSTTAEPSTAVLVISGNEAAVATPGNADSEADIATPGNTRTKARTATPGNAVPDEINGKPVEKNTFFDFLFSLFREKEDGTRNSLPQKAPIKVTITVPDGIDIGKPILAAIVSDDGTQYPLDVQADSADNTLSFILTRLGRLFLANEAEGGVEEPDDPEPEEPEEPDNPGTEDPEKAVYEIFIDEGIIGGTVTADRMRAEEGTTITLTARPDSGYKLDFLSVNGKHVQTNRDGKYSFRLKEDTEVTAKFSKKASGSRGYSDYGDGDGGSGSFADGWILVNNRWRYQNKDGSYASNCWKLIGGLWYSFDQSGYMRTGWYFESLDGYWYYLKADGSMAVGWQQIDGKWYYFNPMTIGITGWNRLNDIWKFSVMDNPGVPQGAMYQSQMTPDGYQVDDQGVWVS